jgi:prevent-host-death family protein
MRVITLADAKAHLSAVLDDVASGQQVVVTRRGRPVARIVAEPGPHKRAATAWIKGLRSFVEAQPMAKGSSVAGMRDADPY